MKAAEKAMKKIAALSNNQLFEVWEMTEHNHSAEVPTVRGWLMDEIEKRFPEAFDRWLESDEAADSELRKYCLA